MDVVYVTGNSTGISNYDDHDVAKAYLPISEWLGCLSNATYVVTNSFHCCVFATHFNRRLGVIMLSGEAKGMNSRMETLSEIRENRMTVIEGNRFDDLLNVFAGGGFKPNGGHSGRAFLACL